MRRAIGIFFAARRAMRHPRFAAIVAAYNAALRDNAMPLTGQALLVELSERGVNDIDALCAELDALTHTQLAGVLTKWCFITDDEALQETLSNIESDLACRASPLGELLWII